MELMHGVTVLGFLLSALYAVLVWRQARGVDVAAFGAQLRALVEDGEWERARALCAVLGGSAAGRVFGAVLDSAAAAVDPGRVALADHLLGAFEHAHTQELALLRRAKVVAGLALLFSAVVLASSLQGGASPWRMAVTVAGVGLVVWGGASLTRIRRDMPLAFRSLLPSLLVALGPAPPEADEEASADMAASAANAADAAASAADLADTAAAS